MHPCLRLPAGQAFELGGSLLSINFFAVFLGFFEGFEFIEAFWVFAFVEFGDEIEQLEKSFVICCVGIHHPKIPAGFLKGFEFFDHWRPSLFILSARNFSAKFSKTGIHLILSMKYIKIFQNSAHLFQGDSPSFT